MSMQQIELLDRFKEKIDKRLEELGEIYERSRNEMLSERKEEDPFMRMHIQDNYEMKTNVLSRAKTCILIAETELISELIDEDINEVEESLKSLG